MPPAQQAWLKLESILNSQGLLKKSKLREIQESEMKLTVRSSWGWRLRQQGVKRLAINTVKLRLAQ